MLKIRLCDIAGKKESSLYCTTYSLFAEKIDRNCIATGYLTFHERKKWKRKFSANGNVTGIYCHKWKFLKQWFINFWKSILWQESWRKCLQNSVSFWNCVKHYDNVEGWNHKVIPFSAMRLYYLFEFSFGIYYG